MDDKFFSPQVNNDTRMRGGYMRQLKRARDQLLRLELVVDQRREQLRKAITQRDSAMQRLRRLINIWTAEKSPEVATPGQRCDAPADSLRGR